MGRTPCCEKLGLRRGRWTAEEDEILRNYIHHNGEGSWRSLPKNAGLLRCGKSCRLRWINYLRSDLKRGNFSSEEEDIIINLHASLGNRWCLIAGQLPGRTDNEIKNYWNSRLSRKIHRTSPQPNTQVAPPPPGKLPRKRASLKNIRKTISDGNDITPSHNQESATNTEEAMETWPSINTHDETDMYSGASTDINNEKSTGSMDSGQISCEMKDDITKHEDSLMMIGTSDPADETLVEDNDDREKLEMKKETPKREPCDFDRVGINSGRDVEWEGSISWGEDENILSHWLSDIDNVNGVEKHKQMMAWLLS
ncbi:uncharacterized protein LOC142519428 [Primulina tabacum]|uniref:uncharacterized protein LOC142519428 n=1 Tax=Primulina tabacum TaxID=48773 RepID=UPI003F59FDEE